MDQVDKVDPGQAAVWNGAGGRGWVEMQELTDRLFQPIEDVLVEAVGAGAVRRVLDVGCGAGETTLAIARRLSVEGECTGIDVSEPLVASAEPCPEGGCPRPFVRADAQRHPLEPASYDMIVSRFGVMFFDDFVEAFANLRRRRATRSAAARRLAQRCGDPFMKTAENAAAPLWRSTTEPDTPGQFALADDQRVRDLRATGWGDIDIEPIDVVCTLPETDLVRYLTNSVPGPRIGPHHTSTQARVVQAVRPAFDTYVDRSEVHFTAALDRCCPGIDLGTRS